MPREGPLNWQPFRFADRCLRQNGLESKGMEIVIDCRRFFLIPPEQTPEHITSNLLLPILDNRFGI